MYLLRDQDFSSRLRLTGQPDADRVVNLYNSLIESMKAERLKTQEQNRFLSLVVDASPLGIAICDFDGNITETNRAWNAMQSPAMTKAIESVADGESQTVRLADALIVRISKLWFMDSGFKRRFILVERLPDEQPPQLHQLGQFRAWIRRHRQAAAGHARTGAPERMDGRNTPHPQGFDSGKHNGNVNA